MNPNTSSQILNDARFRKMIRKKWLLGFGLSAAMICVYAAFVLIMVFKAEWFYPSIGADNPFNIGLLAALSLLLLIMGSMFCYLLFRNYNTHSDIHELINEYDSGEKDGND